MIPLLGLFATFHYTSLSPPAWLTNSAAITEGIEKFGKYFRRKGWLGEVVEPEPSLVTGKEGGLVGGRVEGGGEGLDSDTWNVGADGMKILVEVGTAWAIVKVLLAVRLVGCVWLTPWFARVAVLPITRLVGRIRGK
jgi:hypothetical protein